MKQIFNKSSIITQVITGVGQIMLQENVYTGILFIAGIFWGGLWMGVACLVATTVGTLTAHALKYNKGEIEMGLYGFSPALVGVALVFLFSPSSIIVWACVVVGAALAAVLQHFFIQKSIPAFTFPFIAVTWVLFFILNTFFSQLKGSYAASEKLIALDEYDTIIRGFGEVIFQGSIIAGILFFIGIYLESPISALYGYVGSFLGAVLAYHCFNLPLETVEIGLFGFNCVLSAIVFAGTKKRDGVFVFIAVLLTVVINVILVKTDILKSVGGVFTFPFVAGTVLTLPIKKVLYPLFGTGN